MINVLEGEIKELKAKIDNPSSLKFDQQDFVNLMKSLGDKMRVVDIIRKDKIARKVFVNLYLGEKIGSTTSLESLLILWSLLMKSNLVDQTGRFVNLVLI